MQLGLTDRRSAMVAAVAAIALGSAPAGAKSAARRGSGGADEELVTRYVRAWSEKNADALGAVTSTDMRFTSPTANTEGREAYLAAARRFFPLYSQLQLRAKLVGNGQAMIAYDLDCIPPIGRCPTAELLVLRDGAIASSEIFFDARPFAALMAAKSKPAN